jgi:hypothetical protein
MRPVNAYTQPGRVRIVPYLTCLNVNARPDFCGVDQLRQRHRSNRMAAKLNSNSPIVALP